MKPQTTKKLFAFIAVIMLSVSALVFYNSCQKEVNIDSVKTKNTSTIVYTDVIPDSIVFCSLPISGPGSCISTFYLDLNKDGTNDFSLIDSAKTGGCCNLLYYSPPGTRRNSNVMALPLNGNASFDTIKYFGNVINASLNWSTGFQSLASTVNTYHICPGSLPPVPRFCWGSVMISGSWSGQSDKYLPLRLVVGTKTYYGWARLDVAAGGTSFTIKDYAYNSMSGQSILAGQTH
jgi:hypothetical protein